MIVRKSKKSRKKRGSRTVGGGGRKKRRHSGHKGGKGLAGSHKHRWATIARQKPGHFGKHGFKRLQRPVKTLNVGELDENVDELIKAGLARLDKEKKVKIEVAKMGVEKVLGGGQVSRPIEVTADKFSKLAKKKLEKAGGKAISG